MVDHANASSAHSRSTQIDALAGALRATDTAWADAVRTDDGLGIGQATVLRAVAEGATDLAHLGEVIGRDRSTISVAVKSLVQRRLLERTFDPRDRRRTRIRLTPDGVGALDRISAREERARGVVADALGSEGVDQLVDLLERLRAGLARA